MTRSFSHFFFSSQGSTAVLYLLGGTDVFFSEGDHQRMRKVLFVEFAEQTRFLAGSQRMEMAYYDCLAGGMTANLEN